jgi:hypothetical protein
MSIDSRAASNERDPLEVDTGIIPYFQRDPSADHAKSAINLMVGPHFNGAAFLHL